MFTVWNFENSSRFLKIGHHSLSHNTGITGCCCYGFLFLWFISSCTGSLLQLKGSLIMALRLHSSEACGILVPHPGIQPTSPALEGRFLTTGPPGKSPDNCFNILAYFITIFFLYGTLDFFSFTIHKWYQTGTRFSFLGAGCFFLAM